MRSFSFTLLISISILFSFKAISQSVIYQDLQWQRYGNDTSGELFQRNLLGFDQASFKVSQGRLPFFQKLIDGMEGFQIEAELNILETKTLPDADNEPFSEFIDSEFHINTSTGLAAGEEKYLVEIIPIRNVLGHVEVITKFSIEFTKIPVENNSEEAANKRSKKFDSKLATGDWYKIAIFQSGIYKVDKELLNSMGLSGFDATKIGVYGYGGKELPMANKDTRPNDIAQIPSKGIGLSDGSFDDGDALIFYAEGPVTWKSTGNHSYRHYKHAYSDTTVYFIHVGDSRKEPELSKSIGGSPEYNVTDYDFLAYHEIDKFSEINKNLKTGQQWYGEEFSFTTSQNFSTNLPARSTNDSVWIRSAVVGRSIGSSSSFAVRANGDTLMTQVIAGTSSSSEDSYFTQSTKLSPIRIPGTSVNLQYDFLKTNNAAIGWLNYFEIIAKSKLIYQGKPMFINNYFKTVNAKTAKYTIENGANNLWLWEISSIHSISQQEFTANGNKIEFSKSVKGSSNFLLFDPSQAIRPLFMRKIAKNQNIHNRGDCDLIVVCYPGFKILADTLAALHKRHDNYNSLIVSPYEIYNEFSSGTQDVTAIRDFVRYFYQNASSTDKKPRFLLLLGDASYDFKDRISGNTNMVPSYQSKTSTSAVDGYVSDDYYGLLDSNEGDWENGGVNLLDIAIGRFPINTLNQGWDIFEKIKAYLSKKSFGDWRNIITLIADDEDSNLHLTQTEVLANRLDTGYSDFNLKKIYLDAFVQEVSAGGARYPEVQRRINEVMESGSLIINYIGHGGEAGWAHERILDKTDIVTWRNTYKLPLFVTATCEFSRFDDPERVSAGESVFLQPKGGAIAMLTTTRVVYSGSNDNLVTNLYRNNIFKPVGNQYQTLGEIIKTAKNREGLSDNCRNFSLLGDPALRLPFPSYTVKTTSISVDTLKSLSKVTISGEVRNNDGSLATDFNGILYPTIFDKPDSLQTLANDPDSRKKKFESLKSIIYKGKASVEAGKFSFDFVVPKDISYKIGNGKISYYTDNNEVDGRGNDKTIVIGGTAENQIVDNKAPEAALFVNDLTFVFGGLTNENPTILGRVMDDNGINTVGSGIGHELLLTIDDNDGIVVNEYYESDLDKYTSGTVTYPLFKLSEGKHSAKLKVWDVANNSTEAYTEFYVANSAKLALDNLLCYPNPLINFTTFRFEHNRPNDDLQIEINIFSMSGQIIKSINQRLFTEGSVVDQITWDGSNDNGAPIGKGLYIYQLKIAASDGSTASDIKKLVVLK